eukprot:9230322-Pyramimonas_sp.AAC.1
MELVQILQKPGAQEGLGAQSVDIATYEYQHAALPPTRFSNHDIAETLGGKALIRAITLLKKAARRRAVPAWSMP